MGRTAAEFVLIVVGVLAALAVDQMVQRSDERRLERIYLERLLEDLAEDSARVERDLGAAANVTMHARAVFPLVAGGEAIGLDAVNTVVSSYQATPSAIPVWSEATYVELLSTGGFTLFSDHGLRTAILDYYAYKEAEDWMYDLQSLDYRNAVRRHIDADTQLAIRDSCERQAPTCEIDLGSFDVEGYVRWFRNNQELAGHLTMVIEQSSRGARDYLPEVLTRRDALAAMIRAELER